MSVSTRVLDGAAIGVSGLCLVHCLAIPALAAFLPLLSAWTHAEWVHAAFVLVAAPLTWLALWRRIDGRRASGPVFALGAAGVGLLGAGAFGPEAWDQPLTVAAGLALVATHLMNWRRGHAATQAAADMAARA